MENLLIMGIDTRPMVDSALKLNYKTVSISYFKDRDFNEPYDERHVFDSEITGSYGNFDESYSPTQVLDLLESYLNEINYDKNCKNSNFSKSGKLEIDLDYFDKIVLTTGISAEDFNGKFSKLKSKIRGNLKTSHVNDKFKFHKKIRNKFDVPMTFKVGNIYELMEILKQYDNNQFILKPLNGSGGLGFLKLNNDSLNNANDIENNGQKINFNNYIVQEYIEGVNVSSSVLSTKTEARNLINTRLITEEDMGKENSFAYCGNILPLDDSSFNLVQKYNNSNPKQEYNKKCDINKLNKEMRESSEDLISELNLIGSNGVDFKIDTENESLKIIEVNPRLQGTYQLCENALDINLLEAHIKACEGELIDIPKPK